MQCSKLLQFTRNPNYEKFDYASLKKTSEVAQRSSQHLNSISRPSQPSHCASVFRKQPLVATFERSVDLTKRLRRQYWNTVLNINVEKVATIAKNSKKQAVEAILNTKHLPISKVEKSQRNGSAYNSNAATSKRREVKCPVCNMSMKRKYYLMQHIAAVHDRKKPYKCHICKASFAHNGTLSKHIRAVHMREKRFKCNACGLRFSEKGNLNKHIDRAPSCRDANNLERYGGST